MSNITREDIDRIHDRLNAAQESNKDTMVAVARIEERLKAVPVPPERPCKELAVHLKDHKEAEKQAKATWRDLAVRIASPILAGIGASLATLWGIGK